MASIRILLLEDSPLDAELIRARLTRGGVDFEIEHVDTREAFRAGLESGRFNLILADYSLPTFNGLEALGIAHEGWPHVPFLFVSGGLGEEVAIETLKQGATDYILKHKLDRLGPAVERAISEANERSERRRAVAALRESEERHRLILESVKDYAIITLDLNGYVSSWNSGAQRVLGYQESEIVGRSGSMIFTREDQEAGLHEAELHQASARGRSEDERWHVRKDGALFWGSGVVRPLLDEAGKILGYVKVMRDMTERKRTEEALREADRRKDEFLAMLAHELRNPLSTINNAIQLARRSGQAEHLEWAKEVIGKQVKHLARLIDDLMDISRITRGKIQLRTERQNPARLMQHAVEAVRSLIESRRQTLDVAVEPGIPDVYADGTRLEQVLVNLLTNAAKYTAEGGRVSLSARHEGDHLVVSVRDNGIGISPVMLARVFEPFVQLDQTIDRSQGGLGIGLTLARKLVELHGGTLTASSEGLGRGSEFTVRLPAARSDASQAASPRASDAAAAKAGPRVLVVDDNIDSAKGLASLLETLGHAVFTAFDGPEALEAARAHHPEVVLLDIGLPGMDGYQVACQIRKDQKLKDALLIAITGYGQDEDRRRSSEAGFDYHMVKPVDFDALMGLITRVEAVNSPNPGTAR